MEKKNILYTKSIIYRLYNHSSSIGKKGVIICNEYIKINWLQYDSLYKQIEKGY